MVGTSANSQTDGQGDQATELAIWRWLPSGLVDTSFGSGNGYVTDGSPGVGGAPSNLQDDEPGMGMEGNGWGGGFAIDSQNRIIVVGSACNSSGQDCAYNSAGYEYALWRYLPSGAIDQ